MSECIKNVWFWCKKMQNFSGEGAHSTPLGASGASILTPILIFCLRYWSGCRNRKICKSKICRSRSHRHLTHSRLQVTGCTIEIYCLPHVVVQGPGSFAGLVNFSVPCTVAGLRGVKLDQFSDFGLCRRYVRSTECPSSFEWSWTTLSDLQNF